MNRRGFLQGIFGGVAATGLIVAAKPSEIEAFAAPLREGAPLLLDRPTHEPSAVHSGEHLYNSRGELVGIVTAISVSRPLPIEVTNFGDTEAQFVYGLGRDEIRIEAVGICDVEWRDSKTMPYLKGRKQPKGILNA